ncbi:hypothetical protein [Metaclostridioides mangenotii]|uniref:hypothetical protein n=1 Tax=Metaclostridioides mangenotii TaxID=1540 RepID=UPI0004BCB253|nr:hypothetical protein [Clostridioides mangenotii]
MIATKHKRREDLDKNPAKNIKKGFALWAGFYRKNPHRFVLDYLGISLYPFQQMLIFMMDNNRVFTFLASRGLGKSYLTAVYCVTRCLLYPGTKVIISSKTKTQAKGIIVEKLMMN